MTFRSDMGPSTAKVQAAVRLACHVMDSLSQGLNGLLWGNPAETLSSRAFRANLGTFWHWLRRLLDSLLTPRTQDWCCRSYNRCLERSKSLLRDE